MAFAGKHWDVLNPIEGKDGKIRWRRLGHVFENPSSGTISGDLEQVPLNGRIVLREPGKGKAEEETEG